MDDSLKRYTHHKNAEIPIVIGVSAHRDIREDCIDAVRDKVAAALDEIKALCPHSPIVMLNGLAEGGDQLCAEVALEKGIELIAVLPTEPYEYVNARDFSPESMAKFDYLYGKAKTRFMSPDIEKLEIDGNERNYKFRQQTIFVATRCHVLLALWDGTESTGKRSECGAGAAVDFAINHRYYSPNGTEFYSGYEGAVIKIFSPRKSKEYAPERNLKKEIDIEYLTAADGKETHDEKKVKNKPMFGLPRKLQEVLVHTDIYNKDYIDYCMLQERKYRKVAKKGLQTPLEQDSAHYLIGEEEYRCQENTVAQKLHDCHCVASALSNISKKRYLNGIKALSVLGTLLLLAFILYDQLSAFWAVILTAVAFAVMLGGYVFIKAAARTKFLARLKLRKKFDVHAKFVEYRALSETLRVQYYLTSYSLDEDVSKYFTWSHKNNMAWVSQGITALLIERQPEIWKNPSYRSNIVGDGVADVVGNQMRRAAFETALFEKWIGKNKTDKERKGNGQIGYHLKNENAQKKKIARRKIIRSGILLITLATYVALLVLEIVGKIVPSFDVDKAVLGVFTGRMLGKSLLSLFAAIAFLASYYYGKLSLEQNRADSLNMINLYGVALDRIEEISKTYGDFCAYGKRSAALESLAIQLAREQLVENGSWVAYNRDNGMDLPI